MMYLSNAGNLGESGGPMHHHQSRVHLDFNHNFESSLHRMFEDINKPTNQIEQNQQLRNDNNAVDI